MKEILIAALSGIFTLAGIFLNNYLADKREEKKNKSGAKKKKAKRIVQTTVSTQGTPVRKVQSRQKLEQPREATTETSDEFVFFKNPLWWVLSFCVLAVSVGAGFFVHWLTGYIPSVFNVDIPDIGDGLIALVLGGLVWGIVYIWVGTTEADKADECIYAFFNGYDDIFDPVVFSDFVRGLMSALPINLLLSWIAAIGIGLLSATLLGANLSGVVYLVFVILTFIGVAWFLSEELI